MNLTQFFFASTCLLAMASTASAKPIAFANGTTAMAEYGAGTMKEAQIFHAPRYFWSFGFGHTELDSSVTDERREITYARANYLVKRWNMASAQANIFTWGGVGNSYVSERNAHEFTWNAGAQVDYETRRVYSSLKTDLFRSSTFTHRIDTLQLGVAPYEHDIDTVATWFVLQARRYTHDIHDGTEWALLLRLFKKGAWIEAGATADGGLQAMVMVNF